MKAYVSNIVGAILVSVLVNAPFAIGEFLTRDTVGSRTGFPFTLFVGLWVEMGILAYLLVSVWQAFRNGTAHQRQVLIGLQIFFIAVLAWAWVALIVDQWPCFFLGGSGC